MSTRPAVTTITSGYATVDALNANFALLADSVEDTVGRAGGAGSSLEGALDANDQPILNLGAPSNPTDAARLQDITAAATITTTTAALTSTTAPYTGATARTAQAKFNEGHISVLDFGAVGDSTTDDTVAIQAALDAAVAARKPLRFPAPSAGNYYRTTSPLTIGSSLRLIGDGVHSTTLLMDTGVAGEHVIDFNCLAGDQVENVSIEGLTVRSSNSLPFGIRLKNVAEVELKDVRLYNLEDGIRVEGTRCYSHVYKHITGVGIVGSQWNLASGFTGGGHFKFEGGSLTGAFGVEVESGAVTDNLSFEGTNFEQCVTHAVVVAGTVKGLSLSGCRTEGGDGIDINIAPSGAGEYVSGLSITGTVFDAGDNSAASRISLGGASGKVRGFNISGNTVIHVSDGYTGKMVRLNGDGQSGLITGNSIRGTTAGGAGVVDSQRDGVVVFGNENITGALEEWWGMARIQKSGTYTATGTGFTTSPTDTVTYSVMNGIVTLQLPNISATSNATTFTITGAPTAIRPAADRTIVTPIKDNGAAYSLGLCRVKTTGVFEIYSTIEGGAFTASGTKALYPASVSYPL